MSINKPYRGAGDLPDVIPVFPLSGALLLPRGELPLNIFEPRYLAMIDDALATHRIIGLIQPDSEAADENQRRRYNPSAAPGASRNSPKPATGAISSR